MANKVIQLSDGTNNLFPQHRLTALRHYQSYAYGDTSGTHTFTLVSNQVYLLVITRTNSGSTGNSGLYIVQTHSNTSSARAIASSAVATVSISALTLTVNTTSTYVCVELLPLRDI